MQKLGSLSAVAVVVLVALASSAQAHSVTGTYSVAATPFVSVVCSPSCLGVAGANIGGYIFAASSEIPVSVDIADASGGDVSYTVCQDTNADFLCGDEGEPSVVGCGTHADLSTSLVGFVANVPVSVFVTAGDVLSCPSGSASSGTITLTYAV